MNYDNIRKLIDDMGSSQLTSLEIDFPNGIKIRMRKDDLKIQNKVDSCNNEEQPEKIVENMDQYASGKSSTDFIEPDSTSVSENVEVKEEEYKYIKSPMVGTFYSKPSPNEKSFVEVGEKVKKGATTCIIEAMKLMNEIEAEFDGEVVEVLKDDGDPVEFGENLIKLR